MHWQVTIRYLLNVLVLLLIIGFSNNSFAKKNINNKPTTYKPPVQTSLVVDSTTGQVLHFHNANEQIYPASLTKVMTLYLLFESLESGKLSLNTKLKVSKYAASARPCMLYLKAGEFITVKEVIFGLIIKSANDTARVAAEAVSGSEQKFGRLMTTRARQLGMKNTFFTNASGWHDPKQKTTAIDLAKLSIAIKRDFPQYYGFFKHNSFIFKGKVINGHNHVTANYPGAEGLKTGFTGPAGRNLITAATRNNKSLVGVITGSKSSAERDTKMMSMLDKNFGSKAIVTNQKQPIKTKLVNYKKPRNKKKKMPQAS